MEKQGYREAIELLNESFPGRGAISVKEAAGYIGCDIRKVYECIKRVNNPIPSTKVGCKTVIPITGLARWLCG